MRPAELEIALGTLRAAPTVFVPDIEGTGTTLYAARPRTRFWPQYGALSRARHLDDGAVEMRFPEGAGIRQDVDTAEDLERALLLGSGRHTRAVLAELPA